MLMVSSIYSTFQTNINSCVYKVLRGVEFHLPTVLWTHIRIGCTFLEYFMLFIKNRFFLFLFNDKFTKNFGQDSKLKSYI